MIRACLCLALPVLVASCSKPVDARSRSEVEDFLKGLVQAANDMDLETYARGFRPDCPVTIHFQGKTKKTTMDLYCRSLEEDMGKIERNSVKLLEVEVEGRKGGGYLARTKAKETSLVSGRTVEGETRSEFEIERTAEGLRAVSYESWLTVTRIQDPEAGVFDPRRYPGKVSWDDPEAR